MPIPIKILKLAGDLLDLRNDIACRSNLLDHYLSLENQFCELGIPDVMWISLKVPPHGPVYISDWRFCDSHGEGFEKRIELGEVDKIDAINIDWEKLERSIYEKIEENIAFRTKRIGEVHKELERLNRANERLGALISDKKC